MLTEYQKLVMVDALVDHYLARASCTMVNFNYNTMEDTLGKEFDKLNEKELIEKYKEHISRDLPDDEPEFGRGNENDIEDLWD